MCPKAHKTPAQEGKSPPLDMLRFKEEKGGKKPSQFAAQEEEESKIRKYTGLVTSGLLTEFLLFLNSPDNIRELIQSPSLKIFQQDGSTCPPPPQCKALFAFERGERERERALASKVEIKPQPGARAHPPRPFP